MTQYKFAIDQSILKQVSAFGLEHQLVMAIVLQESSYNPFKIRYEPNYPWIQDIALRSSAAVKNNLSLDTETQCQMMSWGPMQIMGATARDHGFQGMMPELCDVDRGINVGCLYLKSLSSRFPQIKDIISAYNAGHPDKLPDGTYKNQIYVNQVWLTYSQLKANSEGA